MSQNNQGNPPKSDYDVKCCHGLTYEKLLEHLRDDHRTLTDREVAALKNYNERALSKEETYWVRFACPEVCVSLLTLQAKCGPCGKRFTSSDERVQHLHEDHGCDLAKAFERAGHTATSNPFARYLPRNPYNPQTANFNVPGNQYSQIGAPHAGNYPVPLADSSTNWHNSQYTYQPWPSGQYQNIPHQTTDYVSYQQPVYHYQNPRWPHQYPFPANTYAPNVNGTAHWQPQYPYGANAGAHSNYSSNYGTTFQQNMPIGNYPASSSTHSQVPTQVSHGQFDPGQTPRAPQLDTDGGNTPRVGDLTGGMHNLNLR